MPLSAARIAYLPLRHHDNLLRRSSQELLRIHHSAWSGGGGFGVSLISVPSDWGNAARISVGVKARVSCLPGLASSASAPGPSLQI